MRYVAVILLILAAGSGAKYNFAQFEEEFVSERITLRILGQIYNTDTESWELIIDDNEVL